MTFESAKEDIKIAEKAIADSKLDVAVSGLDLLCEIYCLTPFRWQSFYLRVYDGSQYTLQYVKPYVKYYSGLESVSVSFKEAVEADAHIACKGKIFCGFKKVDKDNLTIKTLLDCLPLENEIHNPPELEIDGITMAIINRKIKPSVALYFRTGEKFCINNYTEENTAFLHNLFERIEEIIGNLRRDDMGLCFRELYC